MRKSTFLKFMQASRQFSPMMVMRFIVHLPNFFRLFSRLLKDPRVPIHLKLLCYGSIIYFFFPIDLIKDFPLIFLGYVDDVMLLILAFRKLVKDSPPEIVEEHVRAISENR